MFRLNEVTPRSTGIIGAHLSVSACAFRSPTSEEYSQGSVYMKSKKEQDVTEPLFALQNVYMESEGRLL